MKKGISFLYKIIMLLAVFSVCSVSFAQAVDQDSLSIRGGGPEVAPVMSFNGFSILGGAQGIAISLINPYYDLRDGVVGGAYGQREKITHEHDGNIWGMAARGGLEWGHVFSFSNPATGLYAGFNFNFLTGTSYNRRLFFIGQVPLAVPNQTQTFFFQTELTVNYALNGLLKLGYAWHRYLVYFQAGMAGANVTFHVSQLIVLPTTANYKWDQGYAGGLGLEAMISPKFIVGIDYLYTYYRRMVIAPSATALPNGVQIVTGWLNSQFQTQRVGVYLKYKFSL